MKTAFVSSVAAVGVAFFSLLGPAAAQPSGPLVLTPPQRLEPQRPATDAPEAAPGTPAGRQQAPETFGPGVQVDPLSQVDPDSVGTLSAAEGGFGETLWQDTTRSLVDNLLPRMPVKAASATQRQLSRRLLLSAAPPPAGVAGGTPLISVRVGLLATMGALDDAEALIKAAPNRAENADLARMETDPLLMKAHDVEPVARRLAEWQEAGHPLAHIGKYHGQYQFAGRLKAPIVEIEAVDAAAWLAAHPDGKVVTYTRNRADAEGADLVAPFRGKWVEVWDAAKAAKDPAVLGRD